MTDELEYIRARCKEDGDCWIWTMACSSNGTPKVTMGTKPDRKQWAVRRYVATMLGQNIAGKLVTNKCGDPNCVCPDHLLVVTKKQLADLIVKRTGHPYRIDRRKKISDARRAKVGKLTDEIVREIRESTMTHKEAAKKHGIAKATIGRIKRHEAWKDYSNPFAGLGARS
jgi:hypothetical protein